MPKVAVYLPASEKYSPVNGGALATWTQQIYGDSRPEWDAKVFSVAGESPYPTPSLIRLPYGNIWRTANRWSSRRHFKGHLDWLKLYTSLFHARNAASKISDWGVDVIHVHNDPLAILPLSKRNPNAMLLLHMNNDHITTMAMHWPDETAFAVNASDQIICCSRFILEKIQQAYPNVTNKLSTFPNGADALNEQVVFSRGHRGRESFQFLFTGRLVPDKGVHILVDAMRIVLEATPNAKLVIVGGGNFGDTTETDYISLLKASAQQLGDRVRFVGPVSKLDIAKYLEDADAFVCPSIWDDPFPLAILEAMGAGLPVIAFAKGGIPESLGNAGILVKETSSEALAKPMIKLTQDRRLALELSHKGIARVSGNFSWEKLRVEWELRIHQYLRVEQL